MGNDVSRSPKNGTKYTKFSSGSLVADEIEYVDEEAVHQHLLCEVCLRPLVMPVQHTCGHMYCQGCTTQVESCPSCRGPARFEPVKLVAITQTLDELRVRCKVCRHVCARGVLADHIKKCVRACPLGCGATLPPSEMAEHELACPNKTVACRAADVTCPWTGARKDKEPHEASCHYVALHGTLRQLSDRVSAAEARAPSREGGRSPTRSSSRTGVGEALPEVFQHGTWLFTRDHGSKIRIENLSEDGSNDYAILLSELSNGWITVIQPSTGSAQTVYSQGIVALAGSGRAPIDDTFLSPY